MPCGKCVTTGEHSCHLCLLGSAIESMGLGRMAPYSSKRFKDNSEYATNGISVSARGHKDTSSFLASTSSHIVPNNQLRLALAGTQPMLCRPAGSNNGRPEGG